MAFKELTAEVNASSLGGRTVEQVKKQLSDQKSKVRGKAAAIRRERQKTGGGPPTTECLAPIEDVLLSTMNPQLIVGIISDGETEAKPLEPISQELSTQEVTTLADEEEDELTPIEVVKKEAKKRRFSISSANSSESRVTSAHAESILEIERRKLVLAEELIHLKRIKLRAYLKYLEAKDCDVTEEIQELEKIYKKF